LGRRASSPSGVTATWTTIGLPPMTHGLLLSRLIQMAQATALNVAIDRRSRVLPGTGAAAHLFPILRGQLRR